MSVQNFPIRPKIFWYWIGGILMTISILSGSFLLVSGAIAATTSLESITSFQRIKFPDSANCTVEFLQPGTYQVFYEWQSNVPVRDGNCVETGKNEQIFSSENDAQNIDVSFTDKNGIKIYTQENTVFPVRAGGFQGKSIAEFTLKEPGVYKVNVQGVTTPIVLSFGDQRPYVNAGVRVLLGVVVGFVGFVVSLVMLIVTGVRRGRSKRYAVLRGGGPTFPFGGHGAYPSQGGYPQQGGQQQSPGAGRSGSGWPGSSAPPPPPPR
jgi:hypothetical protein